MTGKNTVIRRLATAATAGVGLLLLAGCSSDAKQQNIMNPAGPAAKTINNLQVPVFIIAGVVGVVVFLVVAFIVLRFREKPSNVDVVPRQLHGAPRLEIAWTLAPAVLLAVIAVPTVKTVFDLAQKQSDALKVTVVGQQWWWEFDYPDLRSPSGQPIVTANELVVPAGRKVQLSITSRDVIHSFWIPRLNGKKDAVPGRNHPLWIQADQPGEYVGQCTEYCGLSHANMRQKVIALSAADWDKWVANQTKPAADATDEAAKRGESTFISQCTRCHTVTGLKDPNGQPIVARADEQLVSGAAPNLTHLMSRDVFAGGTFPLKLEGCTNDPNYTANYPTGTATNCLDRAQLERWLRNPPAMKPMYPYPAPGSDGKIRGMPNLNLSSQQIDDLVAYLSTLK